MSIADTQGFYQHRFKLTAIHAAFTFQHAAFGDPPSATYIRRLRMLFLECPLSNDPMPPALLLHFVCWISSRGSISVHSAFTYSVLYISSTVRCLWAIQRKLTTTPTEQLLFSFPIWCGCTPICTLFGSTDAYNGGVCQCIPLQSIWFATTVQWQYCVTCHCTYEEQYTFVCTGVLYYSQPVWIRVFYPYTILSSLPGTQY